jgi:hypothetical protein
VITIAPLYSIVKYSEIISRPRRNFTLVSPFISLFSAQCIQQRGGKAISGQAVCLSGNRQPPGA